MKKLIFTLGIAFLISSCKKDRTPEIQPVDLGVKVAYNLTTSGYTLPVNGVNVKITNINTGAKQELKTDEKGQIIFKSISAGIYDIDAVYEIDAKTYSELTGSVQENGVTFNASEKSKQIDAKFTGNVELNLIAGKPGDWVIKQVYYAGSDNTEGASFRDQFYEFYNNTDRVLYADSLYFGQLWGRQSLGAESHYFTASRQYDWSKSAGMPAGTKNDDYVYLRNLHMIPGNGKQYPVEPGQSIIVAQTALNHKSPFTDNKGKVVTVRNPALTIDLSIADFEAYYGDALIAAGKTPFASDVDNPLVPNVEIISYYGNDMVLDNNGRDSYVIFKVDGTQNVKSWPKYPEPTLKAPASDANRYYQLPVKYIIDAVEAQQNTSEDRFPKKLSPTLDAGFTFVPMGKYTSQSIIRKTAKIVNGRRILKDTNNSTEDFDFFNVAQPKGFK